MEGEESSPGIEKFFRREAKEGPHPSLRTPGWSQPRPHFLPVLACHQLLECGEF